MSPPCHFLLVPYCKPARHISRLWVAVLLLCLPLVVFTGCVTRPRNALPQSKEAFVQMPGFTNEVRTWGDIQNENFRNSIRDAITKEFKPGDATATNEICILAISGGAANGAYGAGFLTGWSQTGKRPKFKIVTGISTGALMAPFAFLGEKEDDDLMSNLYTNVTSKEIFLLRIWELLTLWKRDHLVNTKPLRNLVYQHYDEGLIERVAVQHRRGRRLYVATTALDAQRPVIWDLGAIAASGHTNRFTLFREVLLASAAIPVAFPPVYLTVEADGKKYDEMHVDGGLINQLFIYDAVWDALINLPSHMTNRLRTRLYVIRNNHLTADWQEVRASLKSIALRSLSTITKSNSYGDLYRLWMRCREYGAEFCLTAIPSEHSLERKEEFDKKAMGALYQCGFEEAYKPGGPTWITIFEGPLGGVEIYQPTPSKTTPPVEQRRDSKSSKTR